MQKNPKYVHHFKIIQETPFFCQAINIHISTWNINNINLFHIYSDMHMKPQGNQETRSSPENNSIGKSKKRNSQMWLLPTPKSVKILDSDCERKHKFLSGDKNRAVT